MTTERATTPRDEQSQLKSLQRDARALVKHLSAFSELKPADPTALDIVEKGLKSLPASTAIAAAVDELRFRARELLTAGRAARAESIGRVESEYIRNSREAGEAVREAGNSAWRINSLELQIDRERVQARALYNKEVVVSWARINHVSDLQALRDAAVTKLAGARLADELLNDLFWDAYEHLRRLSPRSDTTAPRVALRDFYREVRVSLARHELIASPDRKIRSEFPKWAFLHNVDWYRKNQSATSERRLSFETGSQHDHQKGLAMVVNGLDAMDEYKSYCYVYASGGGARS